MLIEMHCHTSEHSPCSAVKARDLLDQVYAKGLQGMVLTDHHYLWPDHEIRALRANAGVPDHFLLLSGQEVSTGDVGDVLVYGAEVALPKGTLLSDIRLRHPHAALVLAHPYRGGKKPGEERLMNSSLDAVEIFSSNHSVAENARGLQDWHHMRFTAVAGTDTHGMSYAGAYPTLFDHPIESIAELAGELRKGRCRPFLKEIPKAGANDLVEEITFGTKGENEERQRIIIRTVHDPGRLLSAERSFYITEEIARHGFSHGMFRVPRFIDNDEEHMLLIEEGLRGSSLFEKLLRSDTEDCRHSVRLAAKWLARLHELRLRITPPGEFLEKEPKRLAKYLERFEDVRHRHTGRASEAAKAVLDAERRLYEGRPDRLVQGHGDYHPKNIYIGQDKLGSRETLYAAAIDFDSSLCLPPAFDVGTFLAQFQNQLIGHPTVLRKVPEEVFFDAYFTASKNMSPEFAAEAELFRARTDIGIASYLIKLGARGQRKPVAGAG